MWPFKKNYPIIYSPVENTIERKQEVDKARGKLQRAKQLKERSSTLATNLNNEERVNHYADRLEAAYRRRIAAEGEL